MLAAISAYYLLLLIPAAIFVLAAFWLSRQRWDRKPRDEQDL